MKIQSSSNPWQQVEVSTRKQNKVCQVHRRQVFLVKKRHKDRKPKLSHRALLSPLVPVSMVDCAKLYIHCASQQYPQIIRKASLGMRELMVQFWKSRIHVSRILCAEKQQKFQKNKILNQNLFNTLEKIGNVSNYQSETQCVCLCTHWIRQSEHLLSTNYAASYRKSLPCFPGDTNQGPIYEIQS